MPSASTYRPLLTTRKLLVSVQNAAEAQVAIAAGVSWIDLKSPSNGALGQPALATCHEFAAVACHGSARLSVALGELNDLEVDDAAERLQAFSVGKIAFAECVLNRSVTSRVQELAARSVRQVAGTALPQNNVMRSPKGRIVPAIYADWRRAAAPAPEELLELASNIDAPYLLVDTWKKDGLGLFQWMTVEQLLALQAQCRLIGAQLVVAGSLRQTDWPLLDELGGVIVGVRGAVCQNSGDRTSTLCPQKLDAWMGWTAGRLVQNRLG